jgi:hypothetical protein
MNHSDADHTDIGSTKSKKTETNGSETSSPVVDIDVDPRL